MPRDERGWGGDSSTEPENPDPFSCQLHHRDGDEDAQSEEDDNRCNSTLMGRGGATVRA